MVQDNSWAVSTYLTDQEYSVMEPEVLSLLSNSLVSGPHPAVL
jgi:hypothetical protein